MMRATETAFLNIFRVATVINKKTPLEVLKLKGEAIEFKCGKFC